LLSSSAADLLLPLPPKLQLLLLLLLLLLLAKGIAKLARMSGCSRESTSVSSVASRLLAALPASRPSEMPHAAAAAGVGARGDTARELSAELSSADVARQLDVVERIDRAWLSSCGLRLSNRCGLVRLGLVSLGLVRLGLVRVEPMVRGKLVGDLRPVGGVWVRWRGSMSG
jgi:hypothetical protein